MSSLRHVLPPLVILTLLSATPRLNEATFAATWVPGKYPQASTRMLELTDLEGLSAWELRVMRNEIFARKGFIYNKGELARYFRSQPWYTPSSSDVSEQLSEIEQANIILIKFQEGKLAYKSENYKEAYENFLVAAQNHNVAAVNYLGMMFEQGYGVDKNLELARAFYQLAAGEGDDWAQERLREIFGEEEEVPSRLADQRSGERLEQSRCVTITEGDTITWAFRNGASPCYRYTVVTGRLPVLTLKPLDEATDVDLVVYNDSELSEQLATSNISGSTTKLLTLSIPRSTHEVYIKVVNYAGGNSEYALYAEQVNLVSIAVEAGLSAAGQAFLRWAADQFIGTPARTEEETERTEEDERTERAKTTETPEMVENRKRATLANLDRAFTVVSSMVQGKSFTATSRDLLINEVKRGLLGDGFMSDFAMNFAVSVVDEVYKHH